MPRQVCSSEDAVGEVQVCPEREKVTKHHSFPESSVAPPPDGHSLLGPLAQALESVVSALRHPQAGGARQTQGQWASLVRSCSAKTPRHLGPAEQDPDAPASLGSGLSLSPRLSLWSCFPDVTRLPCLHVFVKAALPPCPPSVHLCVCRVAPRGSPSL